MAIATTQHGGDGPLLAGVRLAELRRIADRAVEYASAARAKATKRAYASDWHDFQLWCHDRQCEALPAPPSVIAMYLTHLADIAKPATIQRRLTTISQAHKDAGHDSPTAHLMVRKVWAGIRRTLNVAPAQKAPVLVTDLKAMLATLPESLQGARDRALLLIGFGAALRRSELVALDLEDLAFEPQGLVINLRRSKTDGFGEGRLIGIARGGQDATCPVVAIQSWLRDGGVCTGALFRAVDRHGNVSAERLSDRTVARIVQRVALAAGLDPKRYAGHSLRAGLATSAAAAGQSERAIMAQTGHRSASMLRKYVRHGSLWIENVTGRLGL